MKIEYHHGCHNNGEIKDAELCQACAIKLLQDALKRVQAGERATMGTQSIYKETWK